MYRTRPASTLGKEGGERGAGEGEGEGRREKEKREEAIVNSVQAVPEHKQDEGEREQDQQAHDIPFASLAGQGREGPEPDIEVEGITVSLSRQGSKVRNCHHCHELTMIHHPALFWRKGIVEGNKDATRGSATAYTEYIQDPCLQP